MKISTPYIVSSLLPVASVVLFQGDFTASFTTPQYSRTCTHQKSRGWSDHPPSSSDHAPALSWALCMSDQQPDEEGADLAAQFFKTVSDRQISIEGDEIDFADADEAEMTNEISGNVAYEGGDNADEELDDNDDAILREYDVTSTEGSTLTDGQIYDEVKDRVFESAGSFLEMTKGADESGSSEEDGFKAVYQPPSTNPDSGLTAGEVVELVLLALRNNDNPTTNYGIEVLFGYSSPESQIVELIETEGLTPEQYKKFLSSSDENQALFDNTNVIIDKADFSMDRLKAYFTARLVGGSEDFSVNFILSTTGANDDDCWLIDSVLIRPSKMRRRRRR